MRTGPKLAAYAAGLAVVLAAGAGVGAAVGPLGDGTDPPMQDMGAPMGDMAPMGDVAPTAGHGGDDLPTGLSSSAGGYTLEVGDATFAPGQTERFRFRVLGPDGTPTTRFEARHEKELHLVVVSGDLGDYQHLHPALGDDGTWEADLALPRAGAYRAYADFAAAGAEPVTLRADLTAAGELVPQPLPAPADVAATADGYEVHADGELRAGTAAELHFRVSRGGERVTDLEPYLGAYGHLVAIRATDQAYLHVHPTEASSPEEVAFAVEVPSPGRYRLFLDIKHGGVVRTAAFTFDVAPGPAPDEPTGGAGDAGH
jgi:hypothetical protein